ncbi:DNA polymerase [Caulobacter sp. FWC2]|uniref:DNA polymerase n=1 Tax=Caulobacter sp. FWC2 TaxID=69664 RepID=UPI0013042977|nr:DNA polymerase [Caulobacter sp. FWC2]
MRDAAVLAYLPDPFGLERAEFFLSEAAGQSRRVAAAEVAETAVPIVTVEAARLITELRSLGVAPPPDLIDLGEALRLLRGKAKNDGGAKAADPWRMLKQTASGEPSEAATASFQKMFVSETEWPGEAERLAVAEQVLAVLRAAWHAALDELDDCGELQRFDGVERPVAQVFYGRQSAGISVDLAKIDTLISVADREKYTAYNRIAETLGVSPSGLTFRNVGPWLERTDAAHLTPHVSAANFEEYVRLAATYSTFAAQLVTLVRATRDLRALARLRGDAAGVVRPEFQIMGTVTGRILVSNPALQQMRRSYRDVLTAGPGKRLAYLDFAQFEPGILGSLAADRQFLERYNAGDIYRELAIALFNTADRRDVAKRMFLSFSYGMSPDRIVDILGGGARAETLAAFQAFVSEFPGLMRFRKAMEDALQQSGHVETALGNRRYRTSNGELRHDERRWAASQAVQGTASLIFKEAVLRLTEQLGAQVVMLPMHDALLLELPEETYDADVEVAEHAMLSALHNRCPGVSGRVVVADHF